ncbi:hypothetical protein KI387_044289 [Taxus chinensis]|uniref:Uncharacterized protein n=1 Tax=Taxus chinensis TaxID=29808 RepID=A0AA38F8S4_TAXCH|nr:hypothetical protein KI387_044289 [Taxus chinensis]
MLDALSFSIDEPILTPVDSIKVSKESERDTHALTTEVRNQEINLSSPKQMVLEMDKPELLVEKDINIGLVVDKVVSTSIEVTKTNDFPQEGKLSFEERLKMAQDTITDEEIIIGGNSQLSMGNVELFPVEQPTMTLPEVSLGNEDSSLETQLVSREKEPIAQTLIQKGEGEEIYSTMVSAREAVKEFPLNIDISQVKDDQSEIPDQEKKHLEESVVQSEIGIGSLEVSVQEKIESLVQKEQEISKKIVIVPEKFQQGSQETKVGTSLKKGWISELISNEEETLPVQALTLLLYLFQRQ